MNYDNNSTLATISPSLSLLISLGFNFEPHKLTDLLAVYRRNLQRRRTVTFEIRILRI